MINPCSPKRNITQKSLISRAKEINKPNVAVPCFSVPFDTIRTLFRLVQSLSLSDKGGDVCPPAEDLKDAHVLEIF